MGYRGPHSQRYLMYIGESCVSAIVAATRPSSWAKTAETADLSMRFIGQRVLMCATRLRTRFPTTCILQRHKPSQQTKNSTVFHRKVRPFHKHPMQTALVLRLAHRRATRQLQQKVCYTTYIHASVDSPKGVNTELLSLAPTHSLHQTIRYCTESRIRICLLIHVPLKTAWRFSFSSDPPMS